MLVAPEETGYYYRRAELEKIEVGTVLNITPHIGENDDITLDLAIELSDIIGRSKDDFPIVTRRTARNTVRVKNGGTVALAGLTEDRRRLEEKKVPGLSRLPIIGGLFSSTKKRESFREVAIFVTARLVPEAQSVVEPTEPPAEQAPIEQPAEKEFKRLLEESLSRPSKRSQ
jgi:general secretion pathway protein D